MNIDAVLNDFFSNPKVSFYLGLLKTSKWKTLKESEKRKFFYKFNNDFCEFLGIDEIKLDIISTGVKADSVENCSYSYNNVVVEGKDHLVINSIDYNQYLTLYEYIFRVREEFQNRVCFTAFGDKFNSKLRAKWSKNLDVIEFGDFVLQYYIQDDEYLSEYQAIKLDAKKYAESLVISIVKKNYNYNNSYDEQYFMNNKDILVNKLIVQDGKLLLNIKLNELDIIKNEILNIEKKMNNLNKMNLSEASSEDLVLALYPSVNKTLDVDVIIKVYKELFNRIYGKVDIKYSKGKIIVNGNEWSVKYFLKNNLNIILYECLKELDVSLREDSEFLNSDIVEKMGLEAAIVSCKKQFVYRTVLKLDSMSNSKDLVILGEQPLFRLVNKDNLIINLKDSSNGRIPLRKRRG